MDNTLGILVLVVEFFIVIAVAISTILDAMLLTLMLRVLRHLDTLAERSNQNVLTMFGLEESIKDMKHLLSTIFDAKYGR